MKTEIKIIDGKRYNTATATEIAHYWNGLGTSDFRNVSEKLYRTQKGAWFLVGSGGAMSSYAESYGNMSCGGTQWIPLDEDKAFEWLQEHGETEVLEKYFSERIGDA